MRIPQRLIPWITLLAMTLAGCAVVAPPTSTRQVELQFVNHIAAQIPEQDVFVSGTYGAGEENTPATYAEEVPDAGSGYRILPEEAEHFMAAPVYAAAEAQEHDIFVLGEKPFGPYPLGQELGFTMGEWLDATGTGTYTISGEQAELDLTFENLVPNALYTVWCPTIALPPAAVIIDEPCGAADGSQNSFVTDAWGSATFHLTMLPLAHSTEHVLRLIALAYHSDGQSYGHSPGDFGLNSHVHIFAAIPGAESDAWRTDGGG